MVQNWFHFCALVTLTKAASADLFPFSSNTLFQSLGFDLLAGELISKGHIWGTGGVRGMFWRVFVCA